MPFCTDEDTQGRRNITLARLADLDKHKLDKVASIGVVVGFDAEDAAPLSSEAMKGLEDSGETGEVELDKELLLVCRSVLKRFMVKRSISFNVRRKRKNG